ncbi:MAG: helix-turn-helix domain-containing protein [Bacillota bacterium]
MARRDFAVRVLIEIYLHWQAGSSIRRIASSLGTDRNTVRKYVRRAEEAGITRDTPVSEADWVRFIREAFPFTHDPFARCVSFEGLEPYKEHIREALKENKASTVWQRLKDEAGIGVSESTFRRYTKAAMPEVLLVSRPTVWRPEVAPGEEAQIDFGYLGLWEDPPGVRKKAWGFIMVLSFSRHMFVRVVTRMDNRNWLMCHVIGFEFFGGRPQRLVLEYVPRNIFDHHFPRRFFAVKSHSKVYRNA